MARALTRGSAGTSLRTRVLLVVSAAVLGPFAFVLVTSALELSAGDRTQDRTERAAAQVAAFLSSEGARGLEETDGLRDAAEPLLSRHGFRARLLLPDGSSRVIGGEMASTNLLMTLGDVVYGWDRKEALRALEAEAASSTQPSLITDARTEGHASRCWNESRANLRLCQSDQLVEVAGVGPVVVEVSGSSRQALLALQDARRQLIKIGLVSLPLGVMLALWLTRQIVRPIRQLQRQVVERTGAAVPRAGLEAGSGGEIGNLAASFNTLMTALAERSQETEAFLADVAHEFKNPIATIRAAAEQLESPATPSPRRVELAEMIRRSSMSLDALVSQFLDLARAEAGLPNEVRQPVDLSALLSGLVSTFQSDARYVGVTFRVDAAALPPRISAVPGRLESAFRNLLDNAASFAGPQGTVGVSLRASEGHVETTITDSGPGIPPEHLPRLFERFFTTRGDRRGTGLGLALTRAVIEAHGGAITARSPEGQGAQFVVVLPFTDVSHPVR